MKIMVLSRNPALYSTQRLVQAGRQKGHYMIVVDHMRCDMIIKHKQPELYFEGEKLTGIAAVIPRIGATATGYGEAVLRHIEAMNIYSTLRPDALIRSRNKFRAYQILASNGLHIPKSILSNNVWTTEMLLKKLGDAPYIIKLMNSTHGMGVIKSDSIQNATAIIDAFSKARQRMIYQQFIEEAAGTDLRVFVVNGEIVASMMREAQDGDFRSNLHRGGISYLVELSEEEQSAAIKSAKVLGLAVAGVDILRTKNGPMILEVNASPGLEGIEGTSGVDIAGKIITLVEEKIKRKYPF
jgi:ribosomal protein S6--L-glutamate ligase